jgi:hypothetical protein
MEHSRESRSGYPEEAPPEVEPDSGETPEESPPRKGARPGRKNPPELTESGEDKATGDRRSAG